MSRLPRSVALPLVIVTLLLVVTYVVTPRPLDTRVRLEREGSAPFDAEVFHAMLPELLGPVENVAVTPYERLADTTLVGTTYVLLARSVAPDEAEARRLLDYAARGNTLVVIASVLDGPLALGLAGWPDRDSVLAKTGDDERRGLRSSWAVEASFLQTGSLDADSIRLVTPGVAGQYRFPVYVRSGTLDGVEESAAVVRGIGEGDYGNSGPVLVAVPLGRGRAVVSSTPVAFTNAALTGEGDGARFVAAALADVPRGPVLWDETHKPFTTHAETPLRFVLLTPALRWAYGLLLAAGLLAVVGRARRRQRPIPEVRPPPNAQREFARTVGHLHFASGDRRALVARKTRVLLDRLRTDLRLADPDLSNETADEVAARTGADPADVRGLFARLRRLAADGGTDDELVALDRAADRLLPTGEVSAERTEGGT